MPYVVSSKESISNRAVQRSMKLETEFDLLENGIVLNQCDSSTVVELDCRKVPFQNLIKRIQRRRGTEWIQRFYWVVSEKNFVSRMWKPSKSEFFV